MIGGEGSPCPCRLGTESRSLSISYLASTSDVVLILSMLTAQPIYVPPGLIRYPFPGPDSDESFGWMAVAAGQLLLIKKARMCQDWAGRLRSVTSESSGRFCMTEEKRAVLLDGLICQPNLSSEMRSSTLCGHPLSAVTRAPLLAPNPTACRVRGVPTEGFRCVRSLFQASTSASSSWDAAPVHDGACRSRAGREP